VIPLVLALALAAPLPRDARPTPDPLRPGWVFTSRDTGVRYVVGLDLPPEPRFLLHRESDWVVWGWFTRAEIARMERGSKP
jgi:hypothetical protein